MLLRDKGKKEAGILMHISCLPCEYGIGSFGIYAYKFVDFLCETGQKYWQILPLCPIGEGNSPYKSASAFAGEPLFIDLAFLVRDGLLVSSDLPSNENTETTDYTMARRIKLPLLKKAAENFDTENYEYKKFLRENAYWLDAYAAFMAIKSNYGNAEIQNFPEPLKYRMPMAFARFCEENALKIENCKIIQFLFFKQYRALKNYAALKGIKIIGDIPFYVSYDSADVWQNPQLFRLQRDMTPSAVAGVPPDIFSKSGQLWGNPIYDFDVQKKTNYFWWRKRLIHALKLFDMVRIDHFRAFADFYVIPSKSADATLGSWEKGPGITFWRMMEYYIGKKRIIAEDLGGETPEVERLVHESGFPNMKVLQFAFNSDLTNKFLPKHYNFNCVCYTGTHDNNTTIGWYNNASFKERVIFARLVPSKKLKSVSHRLIKYAIDSPARLVIIPIQDYLCENGSKRMNTPGTKKGNWEYRLDFSRLDTALKQTIKSICKGR